MHPIPQAVEAWDMAAVEALLAENVVFTSRWRTSPIRARPHGGDPCVASRGCSGDYPLFPGESPARRVTTRSCPGEGERQEVTAVTSCTWTKTGSSTT